MQAAEQRNWNEALDTQLLRRLLQRARRPGLIDITQAAAIIDRLEGMAANLALADRLNQRWQPVDDETAPAPIVYVTPRPKALNPSPHAPNEPKKARSRTDKKSAKDTGKSTATPVAHPLSIDPVSPPGGSGPERPESQIESLKKEDHGVGHATEQTIVQRKAADAPATIAMPIVSQAPPAATPSVSDVTPQTVQAHTDTGKTPTEIISTPSGDSVTAQQAEHLPLAPTAAQPSAPANISDATTAKPLPVVLPMTRVEERITSLTTATLPAAALINTQANASSEIAGSAVVSVVQQDPPTVMVPVLENKAAVPEYSPTSVLPIVRERILAEVGAARMQQRRPLPLAAAPPSQGEKGKPQPQGASSAAGQSSTKQRRQQPVMMAQGQRQQATTAARDNAVAAANSHVPPDIDIDGIVQKVERRFIRRLAVEAERRRI